MHVKARVRKPTWVIAALATVAALAAAGCTSSTRSTANVQPSSFRKVTYVTGFGILGREAYAWDARAKGYFDQAHLNVTIQAGQAGAYATDALHSGQAGFAIVDFTTAAAALATGKYPDLRVIAAIQQRTIASIIAPTSKHITGPGDLAGKKIAVAPGSSLGGVTNPPQNPANLFTGYAKLAGIDPNGPDWRPTPAAAIPTAVASGAVDGAVQYLVAQPSIDAALKKTTNCSDPCTSILHYADEMGDPYGSVLVTTATLLKQDHQMAVDFVTALMKGLQDSLDHPDQAVATMAHDEPQANVNVAAAAQELRLMKSYVTNTTSGGPIGSMDPFRVGRAIAILQGAGVIPTSVDPTTLVDFSVTPKIG